MQQTLIATSSTPEARSLLRRLDWRIWLGLSLTAAWILLGVGYVTQTIGWSNFTTLPADELGSFLEGAFAPLAFLWLVIGYFLQQKELQQNTLALRAQADEIQKTAEQATIQSKNMAANEIHARQEAFLQIANSVRRQLGSIAGLLFLSSQGEGSGGGVGPTEMGELFNQQSGTDPEVFSRQLLQAHAVLDDPKIQYEMFYGTMIRARHSNNFIFTFERLMKRAIAVDTDTMIRDSLDTSSHGFIYRLAKRHQDSAPPELASMESTGIHIVF